jgi:endo-1,4-beta-xylanase
MPLLTSRLAPMASSQPTGRMVLEATSSSVEAGTQRETCQCISDMQSSQQSAANTLPTRLVNYTGTFKTNGAAYLALYGWTDNPLVEYYVIEAMGNHNPSDNRSATQYGCHQSDGGTYEIWQKKRTNAPSIKGDHTDFQQYWSVRNTMHVGGTINTGNHFRAWAAAGLKLGTQLYMDIVIEGQGGGGNATITVGTAPKTSVPNTPTPTRRTERAAGTCPRSSTTKSSTTTSKVSNTTTTKLSTTSKASSTPAKTTASTTAAVPTTTPATTATQT